MKTNSEMRQTRPNIRRFRPLIFSLLLLGSALLICRLLSNRYFFQVTPSMPKGIYEIKPAQRIEKGQIVLFDVPKNVRHLAKERGWLPKNLAYNLMKPVVAVQGDRVSVSEKGLFVNNRYFGPVREKDSQGLPLPMLNGRFVLKADEYFTASGHANSFDGRYFGPINRSAIKGIAEPVVVF